MSFVSNTSCETDMPSLEMEKVTAPSAADDQPRAHVVHMCCDAVVVDEWAHPKTSVHNTRLVFALFFFIQVTMNLGHGIVPGSTDQIRDTRSMSAAELGFLGMLPYVGLVLGSPIAGLLLQRFSQKWVIIGTLVGETLAAVWIALTPADLKPMLFAARLLGGAMESAFVSYAPVWVEEFAPDSQKTMWVGVVQVGSPVGVMLGYVVGGFASNYLGWEWAFVIQAAFVFIVLSLLVLCRVKFVDHPWTSPAMAKWRSMQRARADSNHRSPAAGALSPVPESTSSHDERYPRRTAPSARQPLVSSTTRNTLESPGTFVPPNSSFGFMTVRSGSMLADPDTIRMFPGGSTIKLPSRSAADFSAGAPVMSQWEAFRSVLRSPLFLIICMVLSVLFFVVTAVQFWATSYFVNYFERPKAFVVMGFAAIAATGPVAGVVLGSLLCDYFGGYGSPEARVRTTLFFTVLGALAGLCGCSAAAVYGRSTIWFTIESILIWFLLFFGGGVVPPATGVLVTSVPVEARALASSIAQTFYNILGYGLGAFLPGVVNSAMGGRKGGGGHGGSEDVPVASTDALSALQEVEAGDAAQVSVAVPQVPGVTTIQPAETPPPPYTPQELRALRASFVFLLAMSFFSVVFCAWAWLLTRHRVAQLRKFEAVAKKLLAREELSVAEKRTCLPDEEGRSRCPSYLLPGAPDAMLHLDPDLVEILAHPLPAPTERRRRASGSSTGSSKR